MLKSVILNAGNAVGYGYADKVIARTKSHARNIGQCVAGKVKAYIFSR